MKTIFEQWQDFERSVIPAEASAVQREEMRRAFYAGARTTLNLVFDAVDPEDSEECELNLTAIDEELSAFPSDLANVETGK